MRKLTVIICICMMINTNYTKAAALNGNINKTVYTTDSSKYIRLQLYKDAINKDETVIFFKANSRTTYEPGIDALYFQGYGMVRMFCYSSDHIPLTFSMQPLPKSSTNIALNVFTKTDGTYKLNLTEINNIPKLFDIWLLDNYLKDSLDIRHNPTYAFNVSKRDSNSFGGKRFTLIVRQNAGRACHLLSFAADKVNTDQVQIKWTSENEQDYTGYTVERSTDNGKSFVAVNKVKSSGIGFYSFTDKTPALGLNFYRLKQVDVNDVVSYSRIAQLVFNVPSPNKVTVTNPNIYPNPVADVVNIVMDEKTNGATYNISISNISGFRVRQKSTTDRQWQNEVSDLKPGIYLVKVVDEKDNRVIGFNKFLKK